MKKRKRVYKEVIHDFTTETKFRKIVINKADENYLLLIRVRGFGPGTIKSEEFILIKKDRRIRKYLISDIKYFKNKKFKAELIFIKWEE